MSPVRPKAASHSGKKGWRSCPEPPHLEQVKAEWERMVASWCGEEI